MNNKTFQNAFKNKFSPCVSHFYFIVFAGKVSVPVAVCDNEEFCSHPKIQKKFADYLDYWKKYISNNYPKLMQCLYLKDWHFTRLINFTDISFNIYYLENFIK